jgi:1,4-dihydroxy-2-naphthoate octaprenyltransferase
MNVLVINGHPRKDSLSTAFMRAYIAGAQEAGATIETLITSHLHFDPNVSHPSPHQQYMEPDISKAQELIHWAQHIVFIYPTWWGTMPALLKGFIDRVFTSGFAFEETEAGTGYEPLLRGKTAEIFTTMDTPFVIYQLIYRAPGHNAMRRAILEFSGITVTKISSFGPVKSSDKNKRAAWLYKTRMRGASLKKGPFSLQKKIQLQCIIWLKALRLQFYPMTFIAYTAGAYGAKLNGHAFDKQLFWLGYAWLFFTEVTTVLSNDLFDYSSDKRNTKYGPFNGGSRVLVNGNLSFSELKAGITIAGVLSLLLLVLLVFLSNRELTISVFLFSTGLFILATGYTVPPLKLSYRGLGEFTVSTTHSVAVIVCGYLYQGGQVADSFPWLLGLPLFFSILPSIIIAGIPDYDADLAVGKRTMAVQLGAKKAAVLALLMCIVAAVTAIIFSAMNTLSPVYNGILFGVIPHCILLSFLLGRYIKNFTRPARTDLLLIIALTYLMWFAVVPLINLF